MMKWQDIPNMYKGAAAIVAVTAFGLNYHSKFITEAEAMEQQTKAQAQLIALRVDGKESEKRSLIRAKTKAVEANKTAEAEQIEQDIQTLRDQINSLCRQIEDC